jgi:hypothetical protein
MLRQEKSGNPGLCHASAKQTIASLLEPIGGQSYLFFHTFRRLLLTTISRFLLNAALPANSSRKQKLKNQDFVPGLPDFSLYSIPKQGKIYQEKSLATLKAMIISSNVILAHGHQPPKRSKLGLNDSLYKLVTTYVHHQLCY